MVEIVEFEGQRRERAPRPRTLSGGSAQILFFTGVRYTRYALESDMPLAGAGKGKREDWFNSPRGKRTKPSSRN